MDTWIPRGGDRKSEWTQFEVLRRTNGCHWFLEEQLIVKLSPRHTERVLEWLLSELHHLCCAGYRPFIDIRGRHLLAKVSVALAGPLKAATRLA